MGKPVIDARHAVQGELHFNTRPIMGKIPNPVIKLLVIQIYKIVAESGYANVTITIKESPSIEETTDAQGQVALKLRNDGSGLRGPVIEITTLDGHLTGDYTLAMTKDGVMAKIPPPTQLLKRFTGGRKQISAPATAAIGSIPAAQEFDAQQEGPLGTNGTDSARFYDSAAPGPRPPQPISGQRGPTSSAPGLQQLRPVPGQRGPTSSAPGLQPAQPISGQRGPISSASGPQQPRPLPGQSMPTYSAPGAQPLKPSFGQKGSISLAPGPQQLRPIPGQTRPTPSAPGPQQLRPHPVQRAPNSTAPSRAPVPATAFSQSGNKQSGPRPGQYQGQQQGSGKSSGREKGGCCSGIGGSGSNRTPAESKYVDSGMLKDGKNKSERKRRRREKKDRKTAEKRMKKQKQKGKKGGYGDSGGMYAEKSGFYDDRKKRSWGCC